jgi:hypothetical protein
MYDTLRSDRVRWLLSVSSCLAAIRQLQCCRRFPGCHVVVFLLCRQTHLFVAIVLTGCAFIATAAGCATDHWAEASKTTHTDNDGDVSYTVYAGLVKMCMEIKKVSYTRCEKCACDCSGPVCLCWYLCSPSSDSLTGSKETWEMLVKGAFAMSILGLLTVCAVEIAAMFALFGSGPSVSKHKLRAFVLSVVGSACGLVLGGGGMFSCCCCQSSQLSDSVNRSGMFLTAAFGMGCAIAPEMSKGHVDTVISFPPHYLNWSVGWSIALPAVRCVVCTVLVSSSACVFSW